MPKPIPVSPAELKLGATYLQKAAEIHRQQEGELYQAEALNKCANLLITAANSIPGDPKHN